MRRSRSAFAAVALLCSTVGVAHADATADLTAALRDAARQTNPQAAFWRSVAAMPDFRVTGDQLRQAIEASGGTAVDPFFASFVGNASGFSKRGSAMAIDLAAPVTIPTPQGSMIADSRLGFTLRQSGDRIALDSITGARVQTATGEMPVIRQVAFRPGSEGQPLMEMTGSVGTRVETQTIDLNTLTPVSNTSGIIGRLDGVAGQGTAPCVTATTAQTTSSGDTVAPTTSGTTAGAGDNTKYTIEMGDTLWDIGQAYGMTVDQLLDYDGGTGVTNRARLAETARSPRHRNDPNWIWHPQEIVLPKRDEAVTPKRHDWNRSRQAR